MKPNQPSNLRRAAEFVDFLDLLWSDQEQRMKQRFAWLYTVGEHARKLNEESKGDPQ